MNDVPVECQGIADQLVSLHQALAAAHEDMANAVGTKQKIASAQVIKKIEGNIKDKQAELERCMGCLPATATFESFTIGPVVAADRRGLLRTDFPSIVSDHTDTQGKRGLSMIFSGCDHESVVRRPGWAMRWSPWNLPPAITVRRLFPDIFVSAPTASGVTITSAPYRISIAVDAYLWVYLGSYDRATGHLEFWCDGRFDWTPIGAPPPLFWGPLYGLNFDSSYYHALFTTRSVPRAIPPTSGSPISGIPLDRATGRLTLVSAGRLREGYGDRVPIELIFPGSLRGDLPVGP